MSKAIWGAVCMTTMCTLSSPKERPRFPRLVDTLLGLSYSGPMAIAPLDKARAIRVLVGHYKRHHKGTTDAQARLALGIPAKDTPALHAWTPPSDWQSKREPKKEHSMAKKSGGGSSNDLVCDPDGGGMTTRSGAHLTAKFPAHTVVAFDAPAVAAAVGGFLSQLLNGNTQDLVQMYPWLYGNLQNVNLAQQKYCAQWEMGVEIAKMLGSGLQAYGITPEQWIAFYIAEKAKAPPLPRLVAMQGQMQRPMLGAMANDAQWVSPLGAPTVVTGQFQTER